MDHLASQRRAAVDAKHRSAMMLLEGGLDWKPLSLSPKDMDFIAAADGE